MKVALCFHGNVGYTEKLRGSNLGELEQLDLSEPILSIKNNLINHYNTDVFMHSWSIDRKEELIKELKPKSYLFEKHKNFSKDFRDRKNATLSRLYSIKKSNDLKKKYEKRNNFKYDVVVHTRFDLIWFTKVPLNQDFENKNIYFPNWNSSEGENDLGPYNKDNINIGKRVYETWFFTTSDISDKYTKLYNNRRRLNYLCGKSWSPHKFFYLQAEVCNNFKVKNVLYRDYDYQLYRIYLKQKK